MLFKPGQVINETYRVDKPLGSGGMADVYVVTHTRLPRQFALKVMRIDGSVREAFLERFKREGEILAALKHRHIVDVMDRHQTPDGNPYMVMELLEGEDLAGYLTRTGPLAPTVALKICGQIGEALKAAHQLGIVHRDLKPSNIFLSSKEAFPNYVKVLDFGIAKLVANDSTPMTAQASLMGTPGYMAPEQALGLIDKIDARTDQFSLAATLYEMLSGKQPFLVSGESGTYAILNRTVTYTPPALPYPQINQAVMRALSKKPEERFPTLADFLVAVGASLAETAIPGKLRAPASTFGQNGELTLTQNRGRTRWFRLGAIGVFAAGVIAIGTWKAFSTKPTTSSVVKARDAHDPTVLAGMSTAKDEAPLPSAADTTAQPPPPSRKQPDQASGKAEVAPTVPSVTTALPSAAKLKSPAPPSTSAQSADKDNGKKSTPRSNLQPRFFVIDGVKFHDAETGIRACLAESVANLRGLSDSAVITLERSGALQVTSAPQVVLNSNFDVCLQSIMSKVPRNHIPQSVEIRITR